MTIKDAIDVAGLHTIRIPAALCGVYGLRPSAHTVPLAGFQPPGAPAGANEMTYLSTLGPLARTAEDLRTALAATAGPLAPCDRAYRWNLAPARHAELKEFRVGFVLDDDNAPVSSEASNALSGLDSCQNYFRDVDIFLSPATLSAAYPHDSRPFHERTIPTPDGELPYVNQVFWIAHAALVGLPAVVAPVGQTPAGLPVGVQVVGPQYDDDTAITFAELLAPLTVGSLRPPI